MLRLGIIGCGKVTTMFHLRAIDQLEGIEIIAVADLDRNRMEEVKQRTGAEKGYTKPNELLEDADVNGVAINTPPKFHDSLIIDSLRMGKHVLCEKPISLSVEGYLSVEKAQNLSNLVVMPVHNYAFTPCLENARKAIQNGEIEDIKSIELKFGNNLWSYGAKTNFRMEDPYNIVQDTFPHALSAIQVLSCPVINIIEVSGSRKRYKVYDNLSFLAETESGVKINGELNWTSLIPSFKLQVLGKRGKIKMDLMKGPYRMAIESPKKRKIVDEKGIRQYFDLIRLKHPAFVNQYKHFMAVIEDEEKPRFTIEDEINMHMVMKDVVSLLSKKDSVSFSKDEIERL